MKAINNLQWKLDGSATAVLQSIKKACETYGNISLKEFIEIQLRGEIQ